MTAGEKLLAEFPPVATEEWEAAIAHDLKGAPYEEKLIWHTPEGIAARPYYRAEDLEGCDWAGTAPGAFPFARGERTVGGWTIREIVAAAEPADANREALAAVAAGTEEIAFRVVDIREAGDLAILLAGLGEVSVHLDCTDARTFLLVSDFLRKSLRTASTFAGFNPLEDLELAAECLSARAPEFVPFTIGVSRSAAAADMTAETGRMLAGGIDFLEAMQDRGIGPTRAASAVEFSFAIGPNFFFEIARLRGFRMLWARVLETFELRREAARARIAACTSYPPCEADQAHSNILRGTTEAIAAIFGGADSICVAAFNQHGSLSPDAARRLARNTQLILKHEAGFARVADPGGGCYYLESLTSSIADAAWRQMQAIQAAKRVAHSEQTIPQVKS